MGKFRNGQMRITEEFDINSKKIKKVAKIAFFDSDLESFDNELFFLGGDIVAKQGLNEKRVPLTAGRALPQDYGQSSGEGKYVLLGSDGLLPLAVVPRDSIFTTITVANYAELLSPSYTPPLNSATIAIVVGGPEKGTYIWGGASWVILNTTGAVTSVNGLTGDVEIEVGQVLDWVKASSFSPSKNQTTLSLAISSIGSAECVLYLDSGSWAISSNFSIPSNISIYLEKGASFFINSGVLLSLLKCPVAEPHSKIFDGSGNALIYDGEAAYVDWWGARADNLTNSSTYINKALSSLSSIAEGPKSLLFNPSYFSYVVGDQIDLDGLFPISISSSSPTMNAKLRWVPSDSLSSDQFLFNFLSSPISIQRIERLDFLTESSSTSPSFSFLGSSFDTPSSLIIDKCSFSGVDVDQSGSLSTKALHFSKGVRELNISNVEFRNLFQGVKIKNQSATEDSGEIDIKNCVFSGCGYGVYVESYLPLSLSSLSIKNSAFSSSSDGNFPPSFGGAGVEQIFSIYLSSHNNNSGELNQISIEGNSFNMGKEGFVALKGALSDVNIRNNKFIFGSYGSTDSKAASINSIARDNKIPSNLKIQGNTFSNCYNKGIYLAGRMSS